MKLQEALKMRAERNNLKLEISKRKASDYANDDVLSNFKVRAAVFKVLKDFGMEPDLTTAEGVAMWDVMLKYLRLTNLYKKSSEPMNESIDDSHLDLENYSELARECRIDSEQL